MGKLSRARGARFELKVRENLEKDGWVVDKWTNNVDLDEGKLVKAKRRYNPYMRALSIGNGFPDFICFKRDKEGYEIIGVEVKLNGILEKSEKEKCAWLIQNNVFSKVLIAQPKKEGRNIIVDYTDFREKHGKKFL